MPHSTPHFKLAQHQFDGPLDLLLQLIEDKRLPITEVSIAEVTEQFLAHLKTVQQIQPVILADFLVVAAKLLVIKSRSLLPALELEGEDEDLGKNLAEQLMALKKFREAAKQLRALDNRRRQSFARDAFAGEQIGFYPDPSVTLATLKSAAQKLSQELAKIAKLPEASIAEVISISEKIEHLQQQISDKAQFALSELLKHSKSRTEVIVTFLALLELVKQKILIVEQEGLFADIIVRKHKKHEV